MHAPTEAETAPRRSRGSGLLLLVAALLLVEVAAGAAHFAGDVRETRVQELAERPDALRGRRIRVAGFLLNRGRDDVADVRPVLTDCRGNFVDVLPWLPFSLPASPPGGPSPPREVMANYLRRHVTLSGELERGEPRVGRADWLVVSEATADDRPMPGHCIPPAR